MVRNLDNLDCFGFVFEQCIGTHHLSDLHTPQHSQPCTCHCLEFPVPAEILPEKCVDYDVQNYVQAEWDCLEHARATLYGLLTAYAIGDLNDEEFEFILPYQREDDE